jgi:hypothetical protein
MRNEILIIILMLLVVIISGCIQQIPKSIKEANVCGDGICGATEDCNNCAEDCGCKSGEYCSDIGVCRTDICGDNICSIEENTTQTCCEDCGCPLDKICNKVNQECQEKPTIPNENIRKIVNSYMSENNITGTIKDILDVYYRNETVKQVIIDCRAEGSKFPCQIILYINNNGEILEVMRTT